MVQMMLKLVQPDLLPIYHGNVLFRLSLTLESKSLELSAR